jgi:hypothetical protein
MTMAEEIEKEANNALKDGTQIFESKQDNDDGLLRARVRSILCERGALYAMSGDLEVRYMKFCALCMRLCVCLYVCVYVCWFVWIYEQLYILTYAHTYCEYMYVCPVQRLPYVMVRIHMYDTYMYTHVYMCVYI